ncbi:MAG: hypothetical protein SPF94_07430, partial [Desulfovibrio sp.]|nr:hypothetical protein [Desulfovibrio sp.]
VYFQHIIVWYRFCFEVHQTGTEHADQVPSPIFSKYSRISCPPPTSVRKTEQEELSTMKRNVVCFIKPDLDTVVAGSLLRAEEALMWPLSHEAPERVLANTGILCLECGGSGRIQEKNFDHHGSQILACATEQAWHAIGAPQDLSILVKYTAAVDTGYTRNAPAEGTLTLSALFSGMRLCHATLAAQFGAGLHLVSCVRIQHLDPNDIGWLPRHNSLARRYEQARQAMHLRLEALSSKAVTIASTPCKVMMLTAEIPGVHGLLRKMGADISLAWNPRRRQCTIAAASGFAHKVHTALALLSPREPGWGGPAGGGIIGSPRGGTRLSLADILACLRAAL